MKWYDKRIGFQNPNCCVNALLDSYFAIALLRVCQFIQLSFDSLCGAVWSHKANFNDKYNREHRHRLSDKGQQYTILIHLLLLATLAFRLQSNSLVSLTLDQLCQK